MEHELPELTETERQQLVFASSPRVLRYIERHFPLDLRRTTDPNDILQQTCVKAVCRPIAEVPRNEELMFRWMATIARREMLQILRTHRTAKRGQGAIRGDSMVVALEQLAISERTPSRSAAAHELADRLEVALKSIHGDYAVAIRLRYIDHLTPAEIAIKMSRSERAVHMLCNRGLRALREQIETPSHFI